MRNEKLYGTERSNTLGILVDGNFVGFYIKKETWNDESNEVPSLLKSYIERADPQDQAQIDYKSFLLYKIQNLFSNKKISDIKFYDPARREDLGDEYVEIEVIQSADDPIQALAYLEGYIERVMAEHGLEVEQSVRDRFEIVYRHINASMTQIINVSQSSYDTP